MNHQEIAEHVIACYLQGKGQREIIANITADDFEWKPASEFFRVILPEATKNPYQRIDDIRHHINRSNSKLKDVIHSLVDRAVSSPAYWTKTIIQQINDETMRRGIRKVGERLAKCGEHYTLTDSIHDVTVLHNVLKSGAIKDPVMTADQIMARYKPDDMGMAIPVTDTTMAKFFGSNIYRRLYIVAGRPSMGKSILTDNLVVHLADNSRGIYVSWDNSDDETTHKLKCMAAGVSYGSFRHGYSETITKAMNHRFKFAPIITKRSMNAYQLRNYIEAVVSNYQDVTHVVIDYFQNVKKANVHGGDVSQYEDAVIEIKRIASELNLAVILLSQVGRGVERDGDNRVSLSDLKWCSALEQEAYYVIGIGGERKSDKRVIDILKNKDGKLDTINAEIVYGQNSFRVIDEHAS